MDEQVSCTAQSEVYLSRTTRNGCRETYFVKRLSDRRGQDGDCKYRAGKGAISAEIKTGVNSAKSCANFCLNKDVGLGVAGFELDCTASTCIW